VVREDSKSIPNQGVKIRTKTFKISNKAGIISRARIQYGRKYQGL
jgi:hypothetical protein